MNNFQTLDFISHNNIRTYILKLVFEKSFSWEKYTPAYTHIHMSTHAHVHIHNLCVTVSVGGTAYEISSQAI